VTVLLFYGEGIQYFVYGQFSATDYFITGAVVKTQDISINYVAIRKDDVAKKSF
jgi:hypothetical protein